MADLKVNITSNPPMSIKLQTPQTQTITMTGNVQPGTKNYNNLTNLPQINGETLIGDKTSSDLHIVSENTEAGWEEMYDYVPKHGEICLYTDTDKIKIGNGTAQIVDLPYIEGGSAEEFARSLRVHTNDYTIHVSEEDREFWDNKLNYSINGEVLVLNRS